MINKTTNNDDLGHCFHCGLEISDGFSSNVEIFGQARPMCCYGCGAVAQTIVNSGNQSYYRHRTEKAATAGDIVPDFLEQISLYDNERIQQQFVSELDGEYSQVDLILEGITCAACLWLNQSHLQSLPGVKQAVINYSTHRARITWDPTQIKLSEIIEAVARIGYMAHPYDARRYQAVHKRQKNKLLKRIGVAWVLGMQIMILAVAMYSGHWSGMEDNYLQLFRWLSLGLVLPILFYSGRPFYESAWKDIKFRHAGVDVPVVIGLTIAMLASLLATVSGQGEVYFDSIAMFIALLLSARYLELVTRYGAAQAAERFSQHLPVKAYRLKKDDGGKDIESLVMAMDLESGDRVRVKPGDIIPADALVLEGRSSVNESLLTGESKPVAKQQGSKVIGGTVNNENTLLIEVKHNSSQSVFSKIVGLIDQAQYDKPEWTALVDRIAPWFVFIVLGIAISVAIYWGIYYPQAWLWVTVSVLIVSCPCALSLATPLALSAAIRALMDRGVLIASSHVFEVIPAVNTVVFDKTGTLTDGQFTLENIDLIAGDLDGSSDNILQIAASLEQLSEHPLAKALCEANNVMGNNVSEVKNFNNTLGYGVSGYIESVKYYLGSKNYIFSHFDSKLESKLVVETGYEGRSEVWLASQDQVLGRFCLGDQLRVGAKYLVESLQQQGLEIVILSGDNKLAVDDVASQLGVELSESNLTPVDKLEYIKQLQQAGKKVVMIGDGVNDTPVLKQSDVSITLHSSTDLAIATSDCVVLSNNMLRINDLFHFANRTRAVIRQNISWAIVYNAAVLPLAASGLVLPWFAASGMAISSFVVTLNALRLKKSMVK